MNEQLKNEMAVEHYEKYEALCKKHGLSWDDKSPRLIGETKESLMQKYLQDPNLNNIQLAKWDSLALAFKMYNRNTGLSLAELVCMQKHAAIHRCLGIPKPIK